MSNKVKINKHTGELFVHSSSSREDRAMIIKKVDGILSFPIKVENIKGNKEDETKVVYGLYYKDSLLQDEILLLTYDNRDDAIATRKAIETAYFKSSSNTLSTVLKIIGVVTLALIIGKYMIVSTSSPVITQQNNPAINEQSNSSIKPEVGNPDYDREAIMKSVEDFKEKQKLKEKDQINKEKALQPQTNNDSIPSSPVVPDNSAPQSDEVKTQGQEFADFLNDKK